LNLESDLPPVLFAFADSKIVMENTAVLDTLASRLLQNPAAVLTIEGHTDNVGSEEYNMNLSKKRAEETKNYLLDKGVDEDQLMIAWFGESKPLDELTKNTEEGRRANRRVELKLEEFL
jgi:OOP family OmpA-OmpF porin